MPAIGFGLVWFGYALGLWGYCKVQAYEVTFGDLVRPSKAFAWPPSGGTLTASSSGSASVTPVAQAETKDDTSGMWV